MAKIWRAGCIIRAKFLDYIKQAYDKSPELATLLVDDYFLDAVSGAQDAWRRVVATGRAAGHPGARLRVGAGLLRRAAGRARCRPR